MCKIRYLLIYSIEEIYSAFIIDMTNTVNSFSEIDTYQQKEDIDNSEENEGLEVTDRDEIIVEEKNMKEEHKEKLYYFIIMKTDKDVYIVSVNPLSWEVRVVKKIDTFVKRMEDNRIDRHAVDVKDNMFTQVNWEDDPCTMYWENLETKEEGKFLFDGKIGAYGMVDGGVVVMYGDYGNQYIAKLGYDGSRVVQKLEKNPSQSSEIANRIFEDNEHYIYLNYIDIFTMDKNLKNQNLSYFLRPHQEKYSARYIGFKDGDFYCYGREKYNYAKYSIAEGLIDDYRMNDCNFLQNDFKNAPKVPYKEISTLNYMLHYHGIFTNDGKSLICDFKCNYALNTSVSVRQPVGIYDKDIFIGVANGEGYKDYREPDEVIVKIDMRSERVPVVLQVNIPEEYV